VTAEKGRSDEVTAAEGADVATLFADHWNRIHGDHLVAAEFWPCCRVLAEADLLAPQETQLTALSIGPFRLAVSKDNQPVIDFIEVLFPAVVVSSVTGQGVTGAVSGVLTAACTVFVKLYRQGTVFGRGDDDRLRWEVLMAVRAANDQNVRPSQDAVVAVFTRRSHEPSSESEVNDAIAWLLGTDDARRPRPPSPLLTRLDDGGLRTTV
jgi:hypothetical protein